MEKTQDLDRIFRIFSKTRPAIASDLYNFMKHILTILLFVALPVVAEQPDLGTRGATEKTPALSQYFSWINNRNEGATESQTIANLEFFKWLHDDAEFADERAKLVRLLESELLRTEDPAIVSFQHHMRDILLD